MFGCVGVCGWVCLCVCVCVCACDVCVCVKKLLPLYICTHAHVDNAPFFLPFRVT